MAFTITELIHAALDEDLPLGDLTTDSLGISTRNGRARLVAKEDLVVSGQEFFSQTMLTLNPDLQIHWHYQDSDFVLKGQTVATLAGDLIPVLKGERVALNFLGHFSGIATYTRCFVREVEGHSTQILDTRKTLPLYRKWEKRAVLDGQGTNHRMNLSDAILIKENHLRLAGGIQQAVQQIRAKTDKPIEVECSNPEEVNQAVTLGVQRILLDNMNNEMIQSVRERIPQTIAVEASGNMSIKRVKSVAQLGVDFISVGALTHSAPCADFSLLFDWKKESSG